MGLSCRRVPLALACAVVGCHVYDAGLLDGLAANDDSHMAAGAGATGGAGGTAGAGAAEPPPTMGTTPTGGTMSAAGGSTTGGAGGVTGGAGGGTGGAGGAAGPPPSSGGTGAVDPGDAQCGGGLRCEGSACVDPATGAPPACTMGGAECAALAGSACAIDVGTMKGACLKSCGTQAACPAPLSCGDFFGNSVCTDATNSPPACTLGGTECNAYGVPCSTAAGITACWRNCMP